jgi:cell division protease FtsH
VSQEKNRSPQSGPGGDPDRKGRPRSSVNTVMSALIAVLAVLLVINVFADPSGMNATTDKTQIWFFDQLYRGQVERVEQEGDLRLNIVLRSGSADPDRRQRFTVEFPKGVLEQRHAEIERMVSARFQLLGAAEFLSEVNGGKVVAVHDAYTVRHEDKLSLFVRYLSTDPASPAASAPQTYFEIKPAPGTGEAALNPVLVALVERFPALDVRSIEANDLEALVSTQPNTFWPQLLYTLLPWVLVIALFYFLIMRQMRSPGGNGGVLSFGRSRAQMFSKEKSGITFDDVAGIDEAKEECQEIIEFLKNPARFSRLGGRIPRGVLLVGPPGTGKTLLAKAIAGEANVPFFSISGSDFVEMFVGVGASRVRDLFRQAREHSPCLVFLDEIDAVGRKRGSGMGGGHDEREQTLNAILVEMDGFDTDQGIILVAATNRPDVLDPALLRPGRFDRQITVGLPDLKGREAILRVHTKKVKVHPGVSLSHLARATPGFSGAELASMVNEAALLATLKNKDFVEFDDFEEARDKVRWGRQKKNRVMEEKERLETAFHEAGHAIVGHFKEGVEPLHKVTIIPRGMSLGATMVLPQKDRYSQKKKELLGYLAFAYGGRCAEELFCDDVSTGASDDIRRATELAREMVCHWGLSEKLGPIAYTESAENVFLGQELGRVKTHSEQTAQLIDSEVRKLLDDAYHSARQILDENRAAVDRVAHALMKYETLTGSEVAGIVAGKDIDEMKAADAERERKAAQERKAQAESEKARVAKGESVEGLGGAQPNPA